MRNEKLFTLNANFSKKWLTPLGYRTSYLDPESISTVVQNNQHSKHVLKFYNSEHTHLTVKMVRLLFKALLPHEHKYYSYVKRHSNT